MHRAAKFTKKQKNDQWNHDGGLSMSICSGLSLKMQPKMTDSIVVSGAWGFDKRPCLKMKTIDMILYGDFIILNYKYQMYSRKKEM